MLGKAVQNRCLRITYTLGQATWNVSNARIGLQTSQGLRSHYSATKNRGPLHGIKILDLTRVLAVRQNEYRGLDPSETDLLKGPFCTQILADYGAEVLKVENPKGGVSDDFSLLASETITGLLED